MTRTYTTQYRPENTAKVDVMYGDAVIAHAVDAGRADQIIASHRETMAARQATRDAYAAAGLQIIRDASDMPRATRFRHMRRVAVIDATGQILAHYASIDELPAIETETTDETDETDETAETTEQTATRGTITAAQVERIMDLIDTGAHEEGGHYSGPTTRAGVEAMSREDAATYIDSLTDQY